jgi:RNA polymerase-binding transcription factor DksA
MWRALRTASLPPELHHHWGRDPYGFCQDTGEPIALRRLEARPTATLSVEAQERHERREKLYRND